MSAEDLPRVSTETFPPSALLHPRLVERPIPPVSAVGDNRIVAIDFETATMARASACSIGIAWIVDGQVTHRAYRLIRPRCSPKAWCFGYIHGLYPEDVAEAAEFPEIWEELRPHLEGALVLAHNASFDLGVLRESIALYGLETPEMRCMCTLVASRRVWTDMTSFRLPLVAERVGFGFDHHHALEDAEAAAWVALGALARCGVTDFDALAETIGIRIGRMAEGVYVSSVGARPKATGWRRAAKVSI